ncbi:MAG: hypothetical protein DSM107014_12855 [Gomphosphaeria aponina SAG 52.96 = DSM 107014]|uniref:Uncharacterized protein n=1 Tax=Gomphosphaeria aponina SAG 52.96 = DSM 107014 TaxID=1521640 RepID=A0A941GS00_9CHRO|nr:hypothetical protein [Gomphosphaeria aponina SAG 52.96 = DSM 107014]
MLLFKFIQFYLAAGGNLSTGKGKEVQTLPTELLGEDVIPRFTLKVQRFEE